MAVRVQQCSSSTTATAARCLSTGRSAAAAAEIYTVLLDGTLVTYTVRVSSKARRVSVRILPAGRVELVLPRGIGRARGEALLHEKAEWVRRTLDRMARVSPERFDSPLVTGRIVSFAGQPLKLHLIPGSQGARVRGTCDGATLSLTLPALDQQTVRAALVTWYRRQAPAIFAERLSTCNTFGFTYGRVSIKEQKSRWGTCSRSGNLNFNWRLLLAPLPVLDYVVIHELAHLREHNHGPRFWALVESTCPAFREHRRWLKLHGHELRL